MIDLKLVIGKVVNRKKYLSSNSNIREYAQDLINYVMTEGIHHKKFESVIDKEMNRMAHKNRLRRKVNLMISFISDMKQELNIQRNDER